MTYKMIFDSLFSPFRKLYFTDEENKASFLFLFLSDVSVALKLYVILLVLLVVFS